MNRRQFNLFAAGSIATFAAGVASRSALAQLVDKMAEELKNGEFNWYPDRSPAGPILIIVSLPDQLMHVYRNGVRVAASTCSTGKTGHRTPTGVFKILQKNKNHRSSTYNNAPMPNMNRLTWKGIALHAGNLPGYPASHGCVRLPLQFSEKLFGITSLGMTVVIADSESHPESVVHPGMVLGDYAVKEFNAVDAALMKNEYAEGHIAQPTSPSVVISRADKSITLLDNGAIVATGKADIKDPNKPLGNRVYTLTGSDDNADDLRWAAMDYGGIVNPQSEDDTTSLERIKAETALREAVRERLKFGMTVVTTDEPATLQYRTSSDFVIIDGMT